MSPTNSASGLPAARRAPVLAATCAGVSVCEVVRSSGKSVTRSARLSGSGYGGRCCCCHSARIAADAVPVDPVDPAAAVVVVAVVVLGGDGMYGRSELGRAAVSANTRAAATASAQKLNSATGVTYYIF